MKEPIAVKRLAKKLRADGHIVTYSFGDFETSCEMLVVFGIHKLVIPVLDHGTFGEPLGLYVMTVDKMYSFIRDRIISIREHPDDEEKWLWRNPNLMTVYSAPKKGFPPYHIVGVIPAGVTPNCLHCGHHENIVLVPDLKHDYNRFIHCSECGCITYYNQETIKETKFMGVCREYGKEYFTIQACPECDNPTPHVFSHEDGIFFVCDQCGHEWWLDLTKKKKTIYGHESNPEPVSEPTDFDVEEAKDKMRKMFPNLTMGIGAEVNMEAVPIYVKEGIEIGKSPWCCCGLTEDVIFRILNQMGDYPQETMEETLERRKK